MPVDAVEGEYVNETVVEEPLLAPTVCDTCAPPLVEFIAFEYQVTVNVVVLAPPVQDPVVVLNVAVNADAVVFLQYVAPPVKELFDAIL